MCNCDYWLFKVLQTQREQNPRDTAPLQSNHASSLNVESNDGKLIQVVVTHTVVNFPL